METAPFRRLALQLPPQALLLLSAGNSAARWKTSQSNSGFQTVALTRSAPILIGTVAVENFQGVNVKVQIEEIQNCPFGEICWYFTSSWEQFRINGGLDVIKSTEVEPSKTNLREQAWFASSLKSRSQFLGPAPRLPRLTGGIEEAAKLDPFQGPVEAFCLITLDPKEVDYLHLKDNKRTVFRHVETAEAGQWMQLEVNP